MKLIVGLGNPGRQYENTPHNMGFDVVDILADRYNGTWALERRFESMTADIRIGDERVTLMKPMTYMNLSGKSVAGWTQKNGGEPHEILPVSDEIHLPLGKLRLRPDGSHGGHKGLLSIINSLGTLSFPRLRVGCKPEDGNIHDWVDFVLRPMKPAYREIMRDTEERAADCIETIIKLGFSTAMNKYNR